MKYLIRLAVITQLLVVTLAFPQQNETETSSIHKDDHSMHWNHIAVFGGATSKFEKEGTHFSIGVDY